MATRMAPPEMSPEREWVYRRDEVGASANFPKIAPPPEDFVRHKDRKHAFDSDGRAIQRHILVGKKCLVGLGKEANRVETGRVLGQVVVGGRSKRYVDPNTFRGSATEIARRSGVTRRTVFNQRRRVNAGRNGDRWSQGLSS